MKRCEHIFRSTLISIIVSIILIIGSIYVSKTVTVLSENRAFYTDRIMIIDPGHGGEDGGASSLTGTLESKLNLEIALRLDDLMHLLGVKTLMIRTSDISIYTEGKSLSEKKISDLRQRVTIANSLDDAILVSIHQNYYPDQRYSGAQVFYANTPDSQTLAKNLQEIFVATINKESSRQAKPADGIYLMKQVRCCAVLIECGFLSNYQEDALLQDASYQKKLCTIIGAVCSNYLAEKHLFS